MRAVDYVRALVSGFPSRTWADRKMAVLQAMADDSGKSQDPVFVLAGLVMNADEWIQFTDSWDAILNKVPRIEYFKMNEAHNREEQFAKFSPTERDQRVRDFTNLIMIYRPLAIADVVPHDLYKRFFAGKFGRRADYPYFISAYSLTSMVMRYQILNGWNLGEKTDFIFDEQGKEGDLIKLSWSRAKEFIPPECRPLAGGTPIYQDEKKFLPLQAADLVAWHVRRFYWERDAGRSFVSLEWERLSKLEWSKNEWTLERLENLATKIRASGQIFEYDMKSSRLRKLFRKVHSAKFQDKDKS